MLAQGTNRVSSGKNSYLLRPGFTRQTKLRRSQAPEGKFGKGVFRGMIETYKLQSRSRFSGPYIASQDIITAIEGIAA